MLEYNNTKKIRVGVQVSTIYGDFFEENDYTPGRKTVMILGNSSNICSLLINSLKPKYNTFVGKGCIDGLEAIDSELIPDLILLDFPDICNDVFELIYSIRKRSNLLSIPILFITGNQYVYKKALQLGATDYIQIPFSIDDIVLKIDSFLEYRESVLNSTRVDFEKILKEYLLNSKYSSHDQNKEALKIDYKLTKKELIIVKLLKKGKLYKEIAISMGISQNTVKSHVFRIYKKCNINNKVELYNLDI